MFQLVPLLRHSPLAELQAFVSLFRHRKLVPNTLVPGLQGLDWAAMSAMFGHCLSTPAEASAISCLDGNPGLEVLEFEQEDVVLKNLEGEGAMEAAERWAESRKMVKTLEMLRVYLTGRERALVDRVLGKGSETIVPADTLNQKGSRIVVGAGTKYLRRNGGSDEDTDSSDAEDARGRTAHQLFADVDAQSNAWWNSSSQSISDPIQDAQVLLVSPKPDFRVGPLTPASSPVNTRSATHDDRNELQIDHLPRNPNPNLKIEPSMQWSPDSKSDVSMNSSPPSDDLTTPFANVNNLLGKRPIPHTPLPLSKVARSLIGSPKRKRRRIDVDLENTIMKSHSPDHSMHQGKGHVGRLSCDGDPFAISAPPDTGARASLFPPLPLPSQYQLPSTKMTPMPLSGTSSVKMMINSERHQIADKLFRARPDLVAPSYALKRTRDLSRRMKSEVREQYQDGLRSMYHTSMVNATLQNALPDHSIPSTDVMEDDSGMNWERSRELTEAVKGQLRRGEPISLPGLACLDSQLPG